MTQIYTDYENLDYIDGTPEDVDEGYDLLGNEIEAGQECHACFGTGLDREWDSDCMICFGDGVL